mmetsp:Transcript_19473/g.58832  ORF Transcript_19473/g.58832 Transcript_19473/m.58832 type:complete len:225 (-) Transcript_19473:131-805(-)
MSCAQLWVLLQPPLDLLRMRKELEPLAELRKHCRRRGRSEEGSTAIAGECTHTLTQSRLGGGLCGCMRSIACVRASGGPSELASRAAQQRAHSLVRLVHRSLHLVQHVPCQVHQARGGSRRRAAHTPLDHWMLKASRSAPPTPLRIPTLLRAGGPSSSLPFRLRGGPEPPFGPRPLRRGTRKLWSVPTRLVWPRGLSEAHWIAFRRLRSARPPLSTTRSYLPSA